MPFSVFPVEDCKRLSSELQQRFFKANIAVWGMPKDVPVLEIRAKLADLGLESFVRGMCFGKESMLNYFFLQRIRSQGLTKELVSQVSASFRKISCRCVLDDVKSEVKFKSMPIECFNRYEP